MEITKDLPSKEVLQRICKAISVLDAILCSEWEYRYYSYNSQWSEGEEFCEMQDMEGKRFQILFKEKGCIINGVHSDYEEANKSILTNGLPEIFQEFIFGEPVASYGTNFCIWTDEKDNWQYTETGKADGKEELLRILDGNPITYKQWAEEYFEVEEIPLDIIKQIYRGETLTKSMVLAVNPEMENWEQLISDLEEINYTFDILYTASMKHGCHSAD